MSVPSVSPTDYHFVNKKLREFYDSKGLIHCYVQNRLDILAACENPDNIAEFFYNGLNLVLCINEINIFIIYFTVILVISYRESI